MLEMLSSKEKNMPWLVYAELSFAIFCCLCLLRLLCPASRGTPLEREPLMQLREDPPTGATAACPKPRKQAATKAFILARHHSKGLLLLKAFKRRKGLHHQLPGGRVDKLDGSAAAAAAREFLEETGVDVRGSLHRLRPVLVDKKGLGTRAYFVLELVDRDVAVLEEFFAHGNTDEHVGFVFEQDLARAAELLALHSGGKSKKAVEMYIEETV